MHPSDLAGGFTDLEMTWLLAPPLVSLGCFGGISSNNTC